MCSVLSPTLRFGQSSAVSFGTRPFFSWCSRRRLPWRISCFGVAVPELLSVPKAFCWHCWEIAGRPRDSSCATSNLEWHDEIPYWYSLPLDGSKAEILECLTCMTILDSR
jgi:hypothetical protein